MWGSLRSKPRSESSKRKPPLKSPSLTQFRTYGEPGRDPRGHVVAVVHSVTVGPDTEAVAGDDAKELQWWDINGLPPLAFDHERIIKEWLREPF